MFRGNINSDNIIPYLTISLSCSNFNFPVIYGCPYHPYIRGLLYKYFSPDIYNIQSYLGYTTKYIKLAHSVKHTIPKHQQQQMNFGLHIFWQPEALHTFDGGGDRIHLKYNEYYFKKLSLITCIISHRIKKKII